MAVSRLTQTTLQNGFEKYNQVWDGRSAVGSMEAISSVTLSANQANVEFNNIPGTYSHLQVRGTARFTAAVTVGSWRVQFNGDTGANYKEHYLVSDGSTASSGTASYIEAGVEAGASATSNIFGSSIMDILDYANTNKNTVVRVFSGTDVNGSGGVVQFNSGLWINTAAIVSLNLFPASGNFVQHSSFTLYGIR